jgi:hypothetical protein
MGNDKGVSSSPFHSLHQLSGGEEISEDERQERHAFHALIKASRVAFGETFWGSEGPQSSPEPLRGQTKMAGRESRRPSFLRIPWRMVERVGRLPGKALLLYAIVWRQGLIEGARTVVLTSQACLRCGITRHQKTLALAELEAHGFLQVDRHHGRNPVVTLLDESHWTRGAGLPGGGNDVRV